MRDKLCVITGGSSGIGKATAIGLARKGATIVLALRTQERGQETIKDITAATGSDRVSAMVCDLSSQASIRAFASEFLTKHERLDVLVHSGGALFPKRVLTEDGIESNFAVAYLSCYLLVDLLRERLVASAPSRIVIVSGEYHRKTSLDMANLMGERKFSMIEAGSRAALAKVVFASELARRLAPAEVCVNSLHPGAVRSGLLRNLPWYVRALAYPAQAFLSSPEKGARTPVFLASSPKVAGVSGNYFINCRVVKPSAHSQDPTVAARLWSRSAELTHQGALAEIEN